MPGPTRTLTKYQMELLSDIFRLILKEIKVDEDKEKLAPGEVGISYTNGCFYVKNPYTGEIFSPNSLDHITQILSKFDLGTNILNADKVSGIKVYSSLSQIPQLPSAVTADTIISRMEYPSILFAEINQASPQNFGFPGKHGMMTVVKIDESLVTATFFDYLTYVNYDGRYNTDLHLLEGWNAAGSNVSTVYCETNNGGNNISIANDSVVVSDMTVLTVKVIEDITTPAYINVNNMGPLPLINFDGTPIDYTITANNIIMLIYDKVRTSWILTDVTASSIESILTIMTGRVNKIQDELNTFKAQTAQKFNDVYAYINAELKKPATIIPIRKTYHIAYATDNIPALADYVNGLDHLVVIYGQTLLHENDDYTFDRDNSIIFNFTFAAGDDVHFIIIKQTDRS